MSCLPLSDTPPFDPSSLSTTAIIDTLEAARSLEGQRASPNEAVREGRGGSEQRSESPQEGGGGGTGEGEVTDGGRGRVTAEGLKQVEGASEPTQAEQGSEQTSSSLPLDHEPVFAPTAAPPLDPSSHHPHPPSDAFSSKPPPSYGALGSLGEGWR